MTTKRFETKTCANGGRSGTVFGVANHGGSVLPLTDLRKLFGPQQTHTAAHAWTSDGDRILAISLDLGGSVRNLVRCPNSLSVRSNRTMVHKNMITFCLSWKRIYIIYRGYDAKRHQN